MDTTQEKKEIEGYLFLNDKDADMAALERRKIDYLEEHVDYDEPEAILRIYEKAINDRIFKTPVGIVYLKKMRDYLLLQESIEPEKVVPIPLYQNFSGELRENQNPARSRVKPSEKQKEDKKLLRFILSVILNILLGMAIIAMFVITLKADQPNILNYEKAITNQYASWEQELTERERIIREKERELNIESE